MKNLSLRLIEKRDKAQVAHIIRTVMPEFGCIGAGYSIEDPEVDDMYSAYSSEKACFYVIVDKNDKPIGCGGIARLEGAESNICELKKMYFLQEARGYGMGRKLMQLLLAEAKNMGYTQIYLETVERMTAANALYLKSGFSPLPTQMGATGHSSCDSFYLREL